MQCSIIQNTSRRCQEETLRAMQKAFCPHVRALSDCSFDFLPRSTAAASDRSQVHAAVLDFVQQQTETQLHLRLLSGGMCNSASLPLTPCLVWLRFFQMVCIFLFCAQGVFFWHLICEEEKSFFKKKLYSGNFFRSLKHVKNIN